MNSKQEMSNTRLISHAKTSSTKMHLKHNQQDTLNNCQTYLRIYNANKNKMHLILKSWSQIKPQ